LFFFPFVLLLFYSRSVFLPLVSITSVVIVVVVVVVGGGGGGGGDSGGSGGVIVILIVFIFVSIVVVVVVVSIGNIISIILGYYILYLCILYLNKNINVKFKWY
jgi:hypothetical protein